MQKKGGERRGEKERTCKIKLRKRNKRGGEGSNTSPNDESGQIGGLREDIKRSDASDTSSE